MSPRPPARSSCSPRPARLLAAGVLALLAACADRDPLTAGRALLDKGDVTAAVIEFKNAVQAEPEAVAPRIALADALERQHDLAGAEQQLRQALEHRGDANVLLPRIALHMLDRGDFAKLVREYKDLRLEQPEADATLRATVVLAQLALGQTPTRALLDGVPATPAVTLARAQLLLADGRAGDAVAALAPALGEGAPWWLRRAAARLATATGDPARGLQWVKAAHEAVPYHLGVAGEYGEALLSQGRFDEAAAVRDRLRARAPNHFATHYLDALLHTRAGRVDEAHAAALKVLAVAPQHVPSTLLVAAAEVQRGDVLLADKRLQALLREQPGNVPALRLLAQAQSRAGQLDKAQETVIRGLAQAPADAQLLGLKAELQAARGQRREAIATLARVAAARPDDAMTLLRLAELKGSLGERAEASRLLGAAAQAASAEPALHGRIVATALRLGEREQARQLAEGLVAARPDDVEARLGLAAAQSALKDGAAAWATTLDVLTRQPAHAGALSALAAMAATPEQQRELRARLARAIEAKPASPMVWLQHASLQRGARDGGPAPLEVLEKGVAAVPGAVPLRAALVNEYLREGRADAALSTAQSGAAANGAPALAVELLAVTQERTGDAKAAAETWRKLVAEHPQRADWKLRLAALEARAGRRAEAASLVRPLLAERPFDVAGYVTLVNLVLENDRDEALSVARQMGRQPGLEGPGLLLEGDVLSAGGDHAEALKRYARAAEAGVAPQAAVATVRTLGRAGRSAAAEQALADALRRHPEDPAVVGLAAQRALAGGDAARAVALLDKLVAKAPGNAVLRNDLAWAQLSTGQPQARAQALGHARRAAAALPDNANVLHTLGVALAANGQRDEALSTLRAASHLAPRAALPRLDLAEQLHAASQREAAVAAMQGIDGAQLDEGDRARLLKLREVLDKP